LLSFRFSRCGFEFFASVWRRAGFVFNGELQVKPAPDWRFHCPVKFYSASIPPVDLPAVRLAPCKLPRKGFELCVSISRRAGFALNGKLFEELAPAAPYKLSRKVPGFRSIQRLRSLAAGCAFQTDAYHLLNFAISLDCAQER